MEKTMNRTQVKQLHVGLLTLILLVTVGTSLFGQSSRRDDPAVIRARQEMEVAQDLGRLLGFIYQMVQEESRLALTTNQSRNLHGLITQVLQTTRLDARTAEAFILRIEDTILTPAQLLYTDRLFAARDATRMPSQTSQTTTPSGTGTPQGTGSGRTTSGTPGTPSTDGSTEGGIVTVYMNGGPYNPLTDISRQQGQDVAALLRYLATRM